METAAISVELRTRKGTSFARKMRKDGSVPGIVYSQGKPGMQVSVKAKDLVMTLRGKRATQIFELKSESKEVNGTLVFVKDIQKEPIKDRLLHVDFLSISKDQKVIIQVPIEVKGEPTSVKQGLAVLEQRAYGVEVECLPSNVPTVFTVEVPDMVAGDSVHADSIELPEGVILRTSPQQTLVTLSATRAAAQSSATVESAGEESTEGAAEGEADGDKGEAKS